MSTNIIEIGGIDSNDLANKKSTLPYFRNCVAVLYDPIVVNNMGQYGWGGGVSGKSGGVSWSIVNNQIRFLTKN